MMVERVDSHSTDYPEMVGGGEGSEMRGKQRATQSLVCKPLSGE
jgi:hypothetical protein